MLYALFLLATITDIIGCAYALDNSSSPHR
jgi:hypothetical protein